MIYILTSVKYLWDNDLYEPKIFQKISKKTPKEVIICHWLDKQFRSFRPNGITIQSLRKTFATRIETTSISTAILNHSSKELTRKFYNDLDYIKYIRVNQLPIDNWLKS